MGDKSFLIWYDSSSISRKKGEEKAGSCFLLFLWVQCCFVPSGFDVSAPAPIPSLCNDPSPSSTRPPPCHPSPSSAHRQGHPWNADLVVLALWDSGPWPWLCLKALLSSGQTNCSSTSHCAHTSCPPQVLGPRWLGGHSGSSLVSCPGGLRLHAYPPPSRTQHLPQNRPS